jgi:flagellar biosynthesis protein FliR
MASSDQFSIFVLSSLALSLRIAPVFVFAPPFSLMRAPKLFLWLMALGLAGMLVGTFPETARLPDASLGTLLVASARELAVGAVPVLTLQLMFGALYMVGRTIDIQSGFGMSLLADPTTRGQKPLIGTLFAYLAGMSFFAMSGHLDLLRFFSASLELVPLGGVGARPAIAALTSYMFSIFLMAFGVGAAAILALFLADISIAALSRTVPQLNALLLGIQVKAILVLLAVPVAIGLSGVLLMQMCTAALKTMARLI